MSDLKIIVCIFFVAFSSCMKESEILENSHENAVPIEGYWEESTENITNTGAMVVYYQFNPDFSFEYGEKILSDGNYRTIVRKEGMFSTPTKNLLCLNYRVLHNSNGTSSMLNQMDTIVYIKKWLLDLELHGLPKTFHQISGEADQLTNSSFYFREFYQDHFIHSKFVFTEDSAFFYSMFNTNSAFPQTWPYAPTTYGISVVPPGIVFYAKGASPNERIFSLYESKLILTYSKRTFKLKP